jgi:hypothetical protein
MEILNHGGRRSGQDRRATADSNYKGIEKRISGDRRKGTRRRKSPRFKAKKGSYAAIDSSYFMIGLIKDINNCGLAFQYVAKEKELARLMTIDIFCNSKDFFLKNVHFKTTSDFYVHSKLPFSTIILRQCGGMFTDLTDNQISQLDRFIKNYTIGEA